VFADAVVEPALRERGVTVTADLSSATCAVVVTATPHELLHPGHFFGRLQHEGDTDFKSNSDEWHRLAAITSSVPTIVIVHMDRPAVVTPLVESADVLIVELGVSPAVVADVLVGNTEPTGQLPFTLFRTIADVVASPCDRPAGDALFPRGSGLGRDR